MCLGVNFLVVLGGFGPGFSYKIKRWHIEYRTLNLNRGRRAIGLSGLPDPLFFPWCSEPVMMCRLLARAQKPGIKEIYIPLRRKAWL